MEWLPTNLRSNYHMKQEIVDLSVKQEVVLLANKWPLSLTALKPLLLNKKPRTSFANSKMKLSWSISVMTLPSDSQPTLLSTLIVRHNMFDHHSIVLFLVHRQGPEWHTKWWRTDNRWQQYPSTSQSKWFHIWWNFKFWVEFNISLLVYSTIYLDRTLAPHQQPLRPHHLLISLNSFRRPLCLMILFLVHLHPSLNFSVSSVHLW